MTASDSVIAQVTALADRFDLDAVYIFGSRAAEIGAFVRGQGRLNPKITSDVDVAVLPRRGQRLNVQEKVRLIAVLEDLLDVARVDLVILSEANPFLAVDIVSGECVYTRDADALAEYELYVLRRAGDLAPFERVRRQQLLEMASP